MKKILFIFLMLFIVTGCDTDNRVASDKLEKMCCSKAGGSWRDDNCFNTTTYDPNYYRACVIDELGHAKQCCLDQDGVWSDYNHTCRVGFDQESIYNDCVYRNN